MCHPTRCQLSLVLLASCLAACGGRRVEHPDTVSATTAPETLGVRQQRAPAAVVLGRWQLTSAATGDQPGLSLTLAVDSARGDSVFGWLVRYFAGNVGADPSQFGPLRGAVISDSMVSIAVELVGATGPGIRLSGRVRGDSVQLTSFRLGPDELAQRPAQWYLVRARKQ